MVLAPSGEQAVEAVVAEVQGELAVPVEEVAGVAASVPSELSELPVRHPLGQS